MEKNKTFRCLVSCTMEYEITASNEKEARKILEDEGGLSIFGNLLISKDDYENADVNIDI